MRRPITAFINAARINDAKVKMGSRVRGNDGGKQECLDETGTTERSGNDSGTNQGGQRIKGVSIEKEILDLYLYPEQLVTSY
jgi:hypothetical protein